MDKLGRFKARAARHGEDVVVYPFVADPSGDYVDPDSEHPDPEDPDYPDTVPEIQYGDPSTVKGFVQAPRRGERGERFARTAHGQEVPIDLILYLPGDQALEVRDKLTVRSADYEVMEIQEWGEAGAMIHKEVLVQKMTP